MLQVDTAPGRPVRLHHYDFWPEDELGSQWTYNPSAFYFMTHDDKHVAVVYPVHDDNGNWVPYGHTVLYDRRPYDFTARRVFPEE